MIFIYVLQCDRLVYYVTAGLAEQCRGVGMDAFGKPGELGDEHILGLCSRKGAEDVVDALRTFGIRRGLEGFVEIYHRIGLKLVDYLCDKLDLALKSSCGIAGLEFFFRR